MMRAARCDFSAGPRFGGVGAAAAEAQQHAEARAGLHGAGAQPLEQVRHVGGRRTGEGGGGRLRATGEHGCGEFLQAQGGGIGRAPAARRGAERVAEEGGGADGVGDGGCVAGGAAEGQRQQLVRRAAPGGPAVPPVRCSGDERREVNLSALAASGGSGGPLQPERQRDTFPPPLKTKRGAGLSRLCMRARLAAARARAAAECHGQSATGGRRGWPAAAG